MKKSIINEKYEKIKEIGYGSFGKVYLARNICKFSSYSHIFTNHLNHFSNRRVSGIEEILYE